MSARRFVRASAAATLALATPACLDLSLPDDVVIACDVADPTTCPSGLTCQPGALVCVPSDAVDVTAPTVTVALTPPLARVGTELAVRVTLDERAAAPPLGHIVLGDDEQRPLDLDESATAPGDQDFTLRYVVRGDEPEGEDVVVTVNATDAVGLVGSGEGAVRFDFTAPAAPPTSDGVVLVAAPGGDRNDGEATRAVVAPVGALSLGDVLVLRTAPDATAFAEVDVAPDGSARVDVPASSVTVWVSARDEAGNESAPVRVDEVVFVGTTSPFDFNAPKAALALSPLADLGPLAKGLSAVPFAGFELRGPMTSSRLDLDSPPALQQTAMVADPARGEVLLVGGIVASTGEIVSDAWAWNGDAWVPRFLDAPPRSGHALAFDPTTGSLTLVGGAFGFNATPKPETWRKDDALFSLESGYISAVQNNTNFELRCEGHGAVFDPAPDREGVLLVHGCPVGNGLLTEQWERAVDGTWTLVPEPADPEGDGNPLALEAPCVVADVTRNAVVLFGGLERDGGDGIAHGETWVWNGASWRLAVASDEAGTSAPSPRSAAFCAWDARRDRVIVGGGFRRLGPSDIDFFHDVWAYDDTGWTRLGDFPGLDRVGAAAAYDARRDEVVVFGGSSSLEGNDTLVMRDDVWRRIPAHATTPPAREGGALVSFGDGLVLYGSTAGVAGQRDTSVWTFDGAWTERGAFDASFNPRLDGRLLVRSNEVLLLGGTTGPTPVPVLRISVATPPVDTSVASLPPGTDRWSDFGAAVDPATGIVAVAGGFRFQGFNASNELGVWFLDGTTWTQGPQIVDADDQSFSAALVHDAAANTFVFYSRCVASDGGDCSTHTLALDGGPASLPEVDWVPLDDAAERPQTRGGAAFVYDASMAAPLLVAGDASEADDGFTDEAYVWRQDHWVTTPILDAEGDGQLPRLLQAAAAYDPTSERTILFGGSQGFSQPFATTFAVDALAAERPAVMATFDPASADLPADATPVALHLVVTAGATASGVDGFVVRVWDRTGWVEVGTADASLAEPGTLELDVDDALTARAMVRGRLPVQVVPLGENGADRARVVVANVEASLRLRLP